MVRSCAVIDLRQIVLGVVCISDTGFGSIPGSVFVVVRVQLCEFASEIIHILRTVVVGVVNIIQQSTVGVVIVRCRMAEGIRFGSKMAVVIVHREGRDLPAS